MKIKLLRPLWNKKKGDFIEAPEPNCIWAITKGYAEFIPEAIEPIEAKVVTEYEKKVIVPEYKENNDLSLSGNNFKILDKEVKKRGRKAK